MDLCIVSLRTLDQLQADESDLFDYLVAFCWFVACVCDT